MKISLLLFFSLSLPFFSYSEEKKKLKGLLVTGGGHHDYATQKNIITLEISKRISVEWDVLFEMDPRRMKGLLGTDDWAKGYDFIFYNFCFAREDDSQFIDKIVEVHKGGVPAIAMHCAMHTFHLFLRDQKPEEKSWNKMLGVVSSGHGPHVPYDVTIAEDQTKHPVVKGLPSKWRTPKGELYMVPCRGSKKKMDSNFMRPLWGIIMRLYQPKSSSTWWPMELLGLHRSRSNAPYPHPYSFS